MSLPYNPPVKVHKFNRRYVLRDPKNKEIIEFAVNSNALDYEKRLVITMQFIADLMNGRKSIEYYNDTKSYQIMDHLNAPDAPPANPTIPGLMANAEQAQVERIIKENRATQGEPQSPINKQPIINDAPPSATEMLAEVKPEEPKHIEKKHTLVEKVKAAVKRRGRPKKK